MAPHDFLDEDVPEPELSKREQRKQGRRAARVARRQALIDAKQDQRDRTRSAFFAPRNPVVLIVGAIVVFGGIATVGLIAQANGDDGRDAGPVKVLHQDGDAGMTDTDDDSSSVAPSATPTEQAVTDPQTLGSDWVVAYFTNKGWQDSTAPAARSDLASERRTFFDGKYLSGDSVNVREWTWRDVSTVSPQWEGTVDVLLDPGRDTNLVASFRMTIDTTGERPVVSKVETLFYGEA